ncbi:Zinc finger protein 567 [Eumeta japonica]|uniref:Zinc finger protein 567 n=1 Tax=Eumeta variegata TaxID=151549 RepID=A0A4C1UEM0_EUMVA|nr:Zinc finger protein 567 [Eumeta japonica]
MIDLEWVRSTANPPPAGQEGRETTGDGFVRHSMPRRLPPGVVHSACHAPSALACAVRPHSISHENVLLLDRSKHKLKSNLQYMGSNDRVKITLEKDDCDEDISIKPEPTINMIDQRSMVFNELNNDLCNNLVNTNKSNVQDSNESESIKLEIFDNDLDDELFDLGFEEVPQSSETIVAEPLALIETDKVDIQKDEQKIVKKRHLKKAMKKERPVRTKHNKLRKLEMDENRCENLVTDQSCLNREEKKKKKIRSVNREITFNESKWKLIHFTEEEAERKFEERREDSFYKTAPYKCDLCLKDLRKQVPVNRDVSTRVDALRTAAAVNDRTCGFRYFVIKGDIAACESVSGVKYRLPDNLPCLFRDEFNTFGKSETNVNTFGDLYIAPHGTQRDRGELSCKFCKMRFRMLSKLNRHNDAHYNEYRCLQCPFIGRTASGAKFHEEMHDGIGYTCETCNENFLGKKNKSIPTAEDELEDRTYCTECKLNFETKEAYSIHLLSATNHAITQDGQTLSQVQEDKIEDKYVPYKSYRQKRHHRCGENFSSVKACIAHHRQAHPRVPYYMHKRVVCDVCGASIQAGNLKIHMNKHTKKIQYPCSICARVFYIKETLKRHMLTHTGEKPWACALCDKTYQQVGSLRLHERTIHQRQKPPPRRRRANNVTDNGVEAAPAPRPPRHATQRV